MAVFEEKIVQLSTGPVTYRIGGKGRTLLYFHDGGGIKHGLEVMETLAQTHRLYMPINPGWDGTDTHEAVDSMPKLADLMAEFAKTVIDEPGDAMGTSFGGYVSLWFAARHPDLLDQLVAECPAGFRRPDDPLPNDPADFRRRLFAYPERAPQDFRTPEMIKKARDAMFRYRADAGPFDNALLAELPTIKARTLVVLGTKDTVIPHETAVLLKRGIPHSHFSYIYDAAHSTQSDQPQRYLRIVKAFLERGAAYIVPQSAAEMITA